MTKLVIYPDNTFELLPDAPPPRKVKPLELAAYLVVATVVCGLGLLALPFVITVLGAIAPFAVVALFLRWLWRTKRCSR
jgi:hypothetical protein